MSPPQRYQKDQYQNSQHQNSSSQPSQPMVHYPPTPSSHPTTPVPLYPTGAAAIIPAPPTYELIPNRIFVGGFPVNTTESDLREHFEKFFPVKDVKMVKSLDGVSKGYGFITFETEDQAEEIRQLNPKQLEFRSRKLNLGPAIRKMNANAFPPGYAMVPASPGSFGYAIPASPGPYGGYPFSTAPSVFVYPPVPNHEQNGQSEQQQQTTPQLSPTGIQQQQSPQVFFENEQESIRTYASAVAGIDKMEQLSEDRPVSSPQPPSLLNGSYSNGQQHWNNSEQQQQSNDSNHSSPYNKENYSQGYQSPPYQPFTQTGLYLNSQGIFQPSYGFMTPPPGVHYAPMMHPPYWQQQQQYPNNGFTGYGYNNWVGPAGDGSQALQHQSHFYQGYPSQYPQQNGKDENSLSRPLQAPRPGKKIRKPSESNEKKKNSRYSGHISPLSASLQSLAISSPTKN
ncbi:hypothetical protein GCK72_006033 [Caenorhabditis remanei]|uniref:Uncharacterized protein n=1 Tax=Caenorhabditis remanei TaxID=31234 RepID=A0A2P4V8A9_CAERE|nr:hypothetical protein GCK72_006033 [Caenorhabditis remanei]KAF1766077.1 hypothetical protein GCK72_006033 [Caenorhabditis remanei]